MIINAPHEEFPGQNLSPRPPHPPKSSCCHCYTLPFGDLWRGALHLLSAAAAAPLHWSFLIRSPLSMSVCLSVQVVALFVLQILLCDVLRGVWCAKSVGICAFGYNTSFAGERASTNHTPHITPSIIIIHDNNNSYHSLSSIDCCCCCCRRIVFILHKGSLFYSSVLFRIEFDPN